LIDIVQYCRQGFASCRCYHSGWFVLFAGKQEIIPFMAANPGVTCDSWTTIRTKVMNEQMAVKNKLKRYC